MSVALLTAGYLLVSLTKYQYATGDVATAANQEQTLKLTVHVDDDFLAEFKNRPSSNSSGSLFYCSLRDSDQFAQGLGYVQWFGLGAQGDERLRSWFWAKGSQQVGDLVVPVWNGVATTRLKINGWSNVDTAHQLTFTNSSATAIEGTNIDFSIRHAEVGDPELEGAVPAAVKRADGSVLQEGAALPGPLAGQCAFQEG